MISENNQEKRVEWCKERLETGDTDFDDIIFLMSAPCNSSHIAESPFTRKVNLFDVRYRPSIHPKSMFGAVFLPLEQPRLQYLPEH